MSVANLFKKTIVQKLSSLSEINKVYNFEETHPTGFPCAFVTLGDHENMFSSTSENRRTWVYRILLLVRGDYKTDEDRQKAEDQLLEIMETVINEFDTDITLDGNALWVDAAVSAPAYYDYEGGRTRGCEITLRVHTDKTVV